MARVWMAPEGDEIVYQFDEDGPLFAANAYGSEPMRGDDPPEGWAELS